jgi:hypothetical protein
MPAKEINFNHILENMIAAKYGGEVIFDKHNLPWIKIDNKKYCYCDDEEDGKLFFWEYNEPEVRSYYFPNPYENGFVQPLEIFEKFHNEGEGEISIPK